MRSPSERDALARQGIARAPGPVRAQGAQRSPAACRCGDIRSALPIRPGTRGACQRHPRLPDGRGRRSLRRRYAASKGLLAEFGSERIRETPFRNSASPAPASARPLAACDQFSVPLVIRMARRLTARSRPSIPTASRAWSHGTTIGAGASNKMPVGQRCPAVLYLRGQGHAWTALAKTSG